MSALVETEPPQIKTQARGNEIDSEDAWKLIRQYFFQHGLVSQQISSYDRFLGT